MTCAHPRCDRTALPHWTTCAKHKSAGRTTKVSYRVECTGCGAVDACAVGSSVSYEDGPRRFAWEHRACAPVPYEATDAFGRIA